MGFFLGFGGSRGSIAAIQAPDRESTGDRRPSQSNPQLPTPNPQTPIHHRPLTSAALRIALALCLAALLAVLLLPLRLGVFHGWGVSGSETIFGAFEWLTWTRTHVMENAPTSYEVTAYTDAALNPRGLARTASATLLALAAFIYLWHRVRR